MTLWDACGFGKVLTYCGWSRWTFLPFHPLAQILYKNPKHETFVWTMVLVCIRSLLLWALSHRPAFLSFCIFSPLSPCSHHSFCFSLGEMLAQVFFPLFYTGCFGGASGGWGVGPSPIATIIIVRLNWFLVLLICFVWFACESPL